MSFLHTTQIWHLHLQIYVNRVTLVRLVKKDGKYLRKKKQGCDLIFLRNTTLDNWIRDRNHFQSEDKVHLTLILEQKTWCFRNTHCKSYFHCTVSILLRTHWGRKHEVSFKIFNLRGNRKKKTNWKSLLWWMIIGEWRLTFFKCDLLMN